MVSAIGPHKNEWAKALYSDEIWLRNYTRALERLFPEGSEGRAKGAHEPGDFLGGYPSAALYAMLDMPIDAFCVLPYVAPRPGDDFKRLKADPVDIGLVKKTATIVVVECLTANMHEVYDFIAMQYRKCNPKKRLLGGFITFSVKDPNHHTVAFYKSGDDLRILDGIRTLLAEDPLFFPAMDKYQQYSPKVIFVSLLFAPDQAPVKMTEFQIRRVSKQFPSCSVPDLLATAFISKDLLPIDHADFFESLPVFDHAINLSQICDRRGFHPGLMVRGCDYHEENKFLRSLTPPLRSKSGGGLWGTQSLAQHKGRAKRQTEEEYETEDESRVYMAEKIKDDLWNVTFYDYKKEDQMETFEYYSPAFGSYHTVVTDGEDDTNLNMSRNNCRVLYNLNVLAMHDPGHALFLQRNPKTGKVTINDPNVSSLQYIEFRIRELLLPKYPFPYPEGLDPGGWCQTWSLFELECTLMDCRWMHDSLVNYFSDLCFYNKQGIFEEQTSAPPFIQHFVKCFKTFRGQSDHPGIGYALSEFVRRLAVRYTHFFGRDDATVTSEHYDLATNRQKRDVEMYRRSYGLGGPNRDMPSGPWSEISMRRHILAAEDEKIFNQADPRAAGFESIMRRYLADGRDRYQAAFVDMCL